MTAKRTLWFAALPVAALVVLLLATSLSKSRGRQKTDDDGSSPKPPNIILFSLDTLRRDFLGAYGYPEPITPNIDRIAARGLLFERAISQSSWTLPAHFSLLTGLYPGSQMIRFAPDHNCKIRQDVLTVPEILSSAGYLTAAFTGGGYMSAGRGLGQGFEVFQSQGRRFEDNLEAVLDWLSANPEQPFFLFLHNFNAHRPYTPPHSIYARFVTDVPPNCAGVSLSNKDFKTRAAQNCFGAAVSRWPRGVDPRSVEYLRNLYAAEVFYLDSLVGKVVERLRSLEILSGTILLVTSDHGDELFDHGGIDHVKTLYQELIHVPLILSGPEIPEGRRVLSPVELVDIAPTLLDLAGVDHPVDFVGASLLSVASQTADHARPVFAATAYDSQRPAFQRYPYDFKATVLVGDWKLIFKRRPDGERDLELYNLRVDPEEISEVSSHEASKVDELSRLLMPWISDMRRRNYCTQEELEAETREDLKALGYLD